MTLNCFNLNSLKQENIKDLIKYVITEPEEDVYDKGHRFPFLACEILSRENLVLVDKIFENKHERKEKTEETLSPEANSVSGEFDSNDSCKTKKAYKLIYLDKQESKILLYLTI